MRRTFAAGCFALWSVAAFAQNPGIIYSGASPAANDCVKFINRSLVTTTGAACATATAPGGSNLQVQYNNAGAFGGYTNTQLTALINAATNSLSGALPAWPGNTTTFFRGDGSYAALPSSFSGLANPSALCQMTANNGVATTAMRSDGSCAIDPAIAPTMSGIWHFSNATGSSNAITGAVVVTGGLGVGDNINGNGNVRAGDGSAFYWVAGGEWRSGTAIGNKSVKFIDNSGANSFTLTAPCATATPCFQFGGANNATPINQIAMTVGSRPGTDSNVGGGNLSVGSGIGTGTGTLSALLLQSPILVGSGTGAQTQTTGWTIKGGQAVATGYTVSTLPTGITGGHAYVTDAVACTFLAALTGGSTTVCPVFFNGTAWVGG